MKRSLLCVPNVLQLFFFPKKRSVLILQAAVIKSFVVCKCGIAAIQQASRYIFDCLCLSLYHNLVVDMLVAVCFPHTQLKLTLIFHHIIV